ncbi:MAG: hypothetical protein JHC95_04495 [Solirubrobacteraceae bacterium]|nr:hypothetical protein [Solirubrobacteraceae bacterium]
MAKRKKDKDLFDRLRDNGLRKRAAGAISSAPGGKKASKQVNSVAKELRRVAADLEDRAQGGPAKRKASAKKAAATRKRKAAARSAAAKKGARTRARTKAKA